MTLLIALIAIVILFLLSVSIILLIIGPTILLKPRRRTDAYYRELDQPVTPAEAALTYEEINVIVDNGVKLNSWLIKSEAPVRGTIIYLHGVGDCKIDGIRFAALMHRHNYNVFLFDARRHGESGGTFCTYGYFEKHDVVAIIDYLHTRTDVSIGRIGLFGTSMGAAVALQAAAIDPRIGVVVAENSFATLRSIFDDYQKRMIKLPFHFLRNLVIARSEWLADFKARDVSPLEAVRTLTIPVLYVYGENDRLINNEYSIALYQNTPGPKELFPVKEAEHHNAWTIGGERYEQKLLDFFGKTLS